LICFLNFSHVHDLKFRRALPAVKCDAKASLYRSSHYRRVLSPGALRRSSTYTYQR